MHVLGLTENNRLWDNIVLLYFDTGKQYLKYHIFYAISTSAQGLVGRNSSTFAWRPLWFSLDDSPNGQNQQANRVKFIFVSGRGTLNQKINHF